MKMDREALGQGAFLSLPDNTEDKVFWTTIIVPRISTLLYDRENIATDT